MDNSGNRGGLGATLRSLFNQHRQVIMYCVFGVCTFMVSMGSYALCYRALGMNVLIANVFSWIFAVLFAFFTNRKWVFGGDTGEGSGLLRQMAAFFGGRLFTLAVEEAMLGVFVSWLKFDGVVVKVIAQVVVVVLNYFISKFWVFRKDDIKE